MEPRVAQMLFSLALIALAVVMSMALRRLGAPGGAILGGLVAGIVLGPTLAGRVAPTWYEQTVIGAFEEREELDRLRAVHGMNRAAREHAGASAEATAPLEAREHDLEVIQTERVAAARWRHQEPMRWLVAGMVGLWLVIMALTRDTESKPAERPDWYQPLVIGLWAAALPGAIGLIFLRWWGLDAAVCLAAGACLGAGAAAAPRSDLEAADQAEPGGRRLMDGAALVAFIGAAVALGWAAVETRGWSGLVHLWPIGLGAAARFVPLVAPIPSAAAVRGRRIAMQVLVPALAALAAIRIELFEHASIWIIVALVLLSGDGRWLGAFIGAMLARTRRALPTMRLVLAGMAAGPTQVALTALTLHRGLVDEPVALALLLGAAVMEMTTPLRAAMAQRVKQIEEEVDGAA